jgi:hypothetical protein
MSTRKALMSLAALALLSATVSSTPALADDQNDDTLWLIAWGSAGAAILTLILTTDGHKPPLPTPVSP